MRKVGLTLIAIAAATVCTTTAKAEGFSWGPKVGLNISDMSNTKVSVKAGFMAGVFAEYRMMNNWFALSGEVLYSRQGISNKYTEDGTKYKEQLKSHYLNIPVLANFYVTDNLALKAGLQAGFNLGASMMTKQGNTKEKDGAGAIFTTADLSIPIGISYDLGPLVLDARYNFGITNVSRGNNLLLPDKSRNNVFTISAGLRF